jgi:AraC-like DNA-binding protein/tetratricopeptide (TPR) repeat protein
LKSAAKGRHAWRVAVKLRFVDMNDATAPAIWRRAREGDYRGSLDEARRALADASAPAIVVDAHLVIAFCSIRTSDYAEASRALDAAANAATAAPDPERFARRIEAWRAELAYFQGRYSVAKDIVDGLVDCLEATGDWAHAAFALRIRIAILLARTDYEGIARTAPRAVRDAEMSGDDYATVQILNILGAAHFDCATSKLPEPHARAHLSSLDPRDTLPMQDEASRALEYFTRARSVAERAGYAYAAWYVSGNIERLQILLGHADRAIPAIRKRLRVLQQRGAKYDEIVTRSNLAWGLRTLGLHREALHELDVALSLAKSTGTFNVLLEFIEYDRSIVLAALGDAAGSRASYRRYVRLVSGGAGDARAPTAVVPNVAAKRPLEPHFMKHADRVILARLHEPPAIVVLARECGVSTRTLEKAFLDFRGLTPVAYVRNARLDGARDALAGGALNVKDAAARYGFRSTTTFAAEFRKRFGVAPSRLPRQRD